MLDPDTCHYREAEFLASLQKGFSINASLQLINAPRPDGGASDCNQLLQVRVAARAADYIRLAISQQLPACIGCRSDFYNGGCGAAACD
jgi:hypothetical protein